jgi:hypothetical protein
MNRAFDGLPAQGIYYRGIVTGEILGYSLGEEGRALAVNRCAQSSPAESPSTILPSPWLRACQTSIRRCMCGRSSAATSRGLPSSAVVANCDGGARDGQRSDGIHIVPSLSTSAASISGRRQC